jgi:hypothetical protein
VRAECIEIASSSNPTKKQQAHHRLARLLCLKHKQTRHIKLARLLAYRITPLHAPIVDHYTALIDGHHDVFCQPVARAGLSRRLSGGGNVGRGIPRRHPLIYRFSASGHSSRWC